MKFPRRVRLSTQAEFRYVFSSPLASKDAFFRVLGRANGEAYCRLGMAVSRKHCSTAVGRNRLKRIIRESFRRYHNEQDLLQGIDFVVLPTPRAASICNKKLDDSLRGHWQELRDIDARRTKNRTNH